MKKIFTLFVMALVAVGAYAFDTYKITFNGANAETRNGESFSGFFSWNADKHNFNNKFTCNYNGESFGKGLKMEGATNVSFTTVVNSNVTIVASTWSEHTIKFDGEEIAIASATSTGEGYRVFELKNLAAGEHSVTRGSGENGLFLIEVAYTEDAIVPMLAVNPKALSFFVDPNRTEAVDSFLVKGENLTDGEYPVILPEGIEGFSVEPANVTVNNGSIEQYVYVKYTSTADVAKTTGDIRVTIDGKEGIVTATYFSRAKLIEQTVVDGDRVWDWETLAETVELSASSYPSKTDRFVLANLDYLINFPAEFKASDIVCKNTTYPSRAKKFQDGTILFQTSVDGNITVDFSDTGSSGDSFDRILYVNDVNTRYSVQRDADDPDNKTGRKTTGDIGVKAGWVEIKGLNATGESAAYQLFKLTFTAGTPNAALTVDQWAEDPSGVSAVRIEVTNGAALYNLAGQKVDAQYKGIVILNGKKVMVK